VDISEPTLFVRVGIMGFNHLRSVPIPASGEWLTIFEKIQKMFRSPFF